MRRLKVSEDIRPMSEFRSGVASFIKQVHETKRPLVITQHGKGVAVLMDVAEYEAMQDKLELYEDLDVAMAQIEDGEGVAHSSAKEMVLKRICK